MAKQGSDGMCLYVAPLAGARIEIDVELIATAIKLCRSPRGSAD